MSLNPRFLTHAAENQPPSLADCDVYATDRSLQDTDRREVGAWCEERLKRMGRLASGKLMPIRERFALALKASILLRIEPARVAAASCASRLDGNHSPALGAGSKHMPDPALANRAWS